MQIRKLLRRYRGGIDFNNTYNEYYHLGQHFKLNLHLPECNPPKPPRNKIVNYPIEEEGWFERNNKQRAHLRYIPLHEAYWYFMPIIPTPFRGEQGDLRLNISIAKLAFPASSADKLGKALLDEYNNYYNSPVIGDYSLGSNTRIIQEVEEHSARRATPFTEEEKQEQINKIMINRGYFEISHFDKFTFNNVEWVRYAEIKPRVRTHNKKYFFATLLENGFYLLCKFTLTTNLSYDSKPWYKDADASIIPIMHGISLQRIASIDDQDNLLTAPSVRHS